MPSPVAFTYYVTLRGQLFAADPANHPTDAGQILLAFGDDALTDDVLRQAFIETATIAVADDDTRAQHARIAASLSGRLEALVRRGFLSCRED